MAFVISILQKMPDTRRKEEIMSQTKEKTKAVTPKTKKEKALKKVNLELVGYRKSMEEKKPSEVYKNSVRIMFTEASANYLSELINTDVPFLIDNVLNQNANIKNCTQSVIAEAMKIGTLGDMTKRAFENAIIVYYSLDHDEIVRLQVLKQQEQKLKEKQRKETSAKSKAAYDEKIKKLKDEREEAENINKKPELEQLSLFGGVLG